MNQSNLTFQKSPWPAGGTSLRLLLRLFRANGSVLLVTDIINHIVFEFDVRSKMSHLIAGTGEPGFIGTRTPGPQAPLNCPTDIAVTKHGYVLADSNNHCLRQIDGETGAISVLAGTGQSGYSGDGGPALSALLSEPANVVVDSLDRIIFTDLENHAVRMITADGILSTIADVGDGQYPCGLASVGSWLAFIKTGSASVSLISEGRGRYGSDTTEIDLVDIGAPSAICASSTKGMVVAFRTGELLTWLNVDGSLQNELEVHGLDNVLNISSDISGFIYATIAQ